MISYDLRACSRVKIRSLYRRSVPGFGAEPRQQPKRAASGRKDASHAAYAAEKCRCHGGDRQEAAYVNKMAGIGKQPLIRNGKTDNAEREN